MTHDIPDGLAQLRSILRERFTGLVPEAAHRQTAEERERNFLSRALAAYAVQKLAKCSPGEAADSVVDGGGDRESLWSLEKVFPDDVDAPSRYSRVFRPSRSARAVWRAVQAQRCVTDAVHENFQEADERRKEFGRYAGWLVLNLIFLRLKPERGDGMTLPEDMRETLKTTAQEYADRLWTSCVSQNVPERPMREVFGSVRDCARLRAAMLAELNRT